jgi:hypothetical protein
MDLSPKIEIVYNQPENSQTSVGTSSLIFEKKAPKVVLTQKNSESSSSDDDDSLESLKGTTIAIGPRLSQLQEIVTTLDMKNTEDHLQIFQHIEKVNAERKLSTEFNRQMREDIGLIKTKIDNIEKLYAILNNGLSAAQQSETLRNQKESKTAQEELAKVLQKIETNADLTEVKQQYNELKAQFDELCTRLAQNPASSPLLNKIMSTPRLNSARTSGNQTSSTTTNEITLEDILTQYQQELLEMGKMIQQLNAAQKPDYQKIIDDLSKKVTAVENRSETIIRRARFFTIGSVAALLVSFLIWLQTNKA